MTSAKFAATMGKIICVLRSGFYKMAKKSSSEKSVAKRRSKKNVKPTAGEMEKIILLVVKMLSTGFHSGEIKKAIAGQFKCAPRTVENHLRRARLEMRKATGISADDHRADSYHFYLTVIRDRTAPLKDKLKARERIDKLLGLELQESESGGDTTNNISINWDSLVDSNSKPQNIIEV